MESPWSYYDKIEEQENYKLSLIATLRVWRNRDQNDHIIFSRSDVIKLLKEIDNA